MDTNTLYYGDNLDILARYVKDETVDLVYLDPPFNSNASYNILFGEADGTRAASQIKAFDDTWQWDQSAAFAYKKTVEQGGQVSRALQAFRTILGENTMLAYLAMMAPRLVELRRVMKPTASIYLHCDPTASHYLKMLMDAIFGVVNYRNEIDWVRTNAHNFKSKHYVKTNDVILFYSKTDNYIWNQQFAPYSEQQLKRYKDEDIEGEGEARKYTGQDLTLTGNSSSRQFEWRGARPPANRVWGYPKETLEEMWDKGLILLKRDGTPRLDGHKVYLDEMPGKPISTIWDDIPRIGNTHAERMGYPTQKPLALLERIIAASSNPGDVVLDPFCGCGTAVAAAQNLKRQWIGIDITHLAVTLMKHRLWDSFGNDIPFEVIGEPVSIPDAQALAASDPYQFQWWALGLVGARPVETKKGADKGIDGELYFHDDTTNGTTKRVILSVKAGHTSVAQLRDLSGVLSREQAEIGVLITMANPTKPMRIEAASAGFYDSPWGSSHPRLQLLTVEELLNGSSIDYPASRGNVTFKIAEKVKNGKDHPEFPI